MTLSDYSKLKQLVVLSIDSSHNTLLRTLKEVFKNGINSVRRFEQINTIEQLLKILELRDLLSEDNVTPLKLIAKKTKNLDLLNRINDYEETHVPRNIHYYASEKRNTPLSTEYSIHNTAPLIGTGTYDRKKELIFKTVTEQIGSAWRDLARSLRIQECVIDEIDANNTSMATKASKMLKRFESRADRLKWHFVLCEALDRIRRKELRYTVQEIMMMNL